MGILTELLVPLQPLTGDLSKLSTPVFVAVATAAFVVLSVVLNVVQQIVFKDKGKPPVVFHFFPFFGSTVVYGMDPYAFFASNQEKYGDVFTFILLGKKMTVCLGPNGNDFVLNGKLAEVSAEEAYTHLTTPVFGEGVVYDCPNHRLMEQKKFMKFGLTTETFKSYVPLIVEQVEDYIKKSKYFKGPTGSVPLMNIIPEVTIFTASRSLQGKEVRDALDGSFAALYHDLDLGFNPMNFMFPWFPFPGNKRRDAAQRKMARFYMDLIDKRRKDPNAASKEKDMLWNLMDRSYKDGKEISDREVAHMMIALLMAGQHTSMATTTWLLLHLAEKPEVVAELWAEQQAICGQDPRPLAYEDLAKMPLLNNVIREVLRMHPPIHSIIRKVKSPMHVKSQNYVIPAGYHVLAAPGASAMDEKYFKNANEFDPHRWDEVEEEDAGEKFDFGYGLVSKGTASPYLPFGAGRHRCIGEQFANVQLGSIIATFVRTFTFSLPGDGKVPGPDYTSMITLPTQPAAINWKKRNP
ncbi:cytochrome P450 [Pyronema domesticum]|uniref:Similar to Lanosterol 14-alpha demethylase acc. no. P10614 n=1 Tax=Pyronema omphalodes (strain CBS 100304) TaxID=1076935 RepID=U4L073_PYROM|nr:cytochrome P450 [Pyronema domesticum]CCX05384.1 Similar to Lanosterol 14-alpha demethylase; acc. no. P10614 [Pyronema omphalodes CBS 100304]